MTVCGHCQTDIGSRPYAGKRDFPSATTIAGAYDDGKSRSFAWSASLIAATTAVHHPDTWSGLGTEGCNEEKDGLCPACRYVRSEFDRRWNAKAALGTHIHHLLLSWSEGVEIDVDAASEPYIDAAEKFLLDTEPRWVEVERTVLYDSPRSHGYRGQLDWIAEINCPVCPPGSRCKWLGDWKGLSLDTPIPTPSGWTTMAAVQVGDLVFGADGHPHQVVGKSSIHQRPCYRVSFDDGSSIVCDNEHLWSLMAGRPEHSRAVVMSTEDLAAVVVGSHGQRDKRVLNAAPLSLPERELPVHPYVLGCWLGDGNRHNGTIVKPDDDLFANIQACGYPVGNRHAAPEGSVGARNVEGLVGQLRRADLLRNKHIPDVYLRGSVSQRLALLQGLMDTDGTWNRLRRQAVFTNTDKALAAAVQELVVSLGWRASAHSHPATGFGVTTTSHNVYFTPHGMNPFRLPRKADLVNVQGTARGRRRLVTDVTRTVDVPTQCIAVDSPDHTYLCGYQMVPTHNTGGFYPKSQTLQLSAYRCAQHLTAWEDKTETVTGPVPKVAHAGVCLLGGDGNYQLIELPANGDAHAVFLRLRDAWGWHKQMTKWERERVLPPEAQTENGEAAA